VNLQRELFTQWILGHWSGGLGAVGVLLIMQGREIGLPLFLISVPLFLWGMHHAAQCERKAA
jgi:hypothetical protein